MSHIPADLRRRVVERAMGRCEYCRLSQVRQEAAFHVDHVIPASAAGPTVLENLSLACVSCSLRKAARTTGWDSGSQSIVPLYNPRVDRWSDHFRWNGVLVVGVTTTGRATVDALRMNRTLAVAIRLEEAYWGRHPPPDPPLPGA